MTDATDLERAEALLDRGEPEAAEALVAQLVEQHLDWIEGQAWLARQRWMAGDDSYARSFERALEQHPRNPGLWQAWIALDFHAGRFADALEKIARAEAATGARPQWLAQRATALDEMGDQAAAGALFTALDPRLDVSVAVRVTRHRLRKGDCRGAAAACEPWLGTAQANTVWPYLALAWRLDDDPRWEWLECQPGLIGVSDPQFGHGELDALADATRLLHRATRQPIDQSLSGGTQTPGALLERSEPLFRALRATLAASVAEHYAKLPPRDPFHPTLRHGRDTPVKFSGSWSVRLTAGGHHTAHVHTQGWFSSAFYLSLPEQESDQPDDAGWLALGEAPGELGLDLPPLRLVEPAVGRLVLFPSTMWHATRPFARGERLTVAFDLAPPEA